ncbi:MAG: proton-conducting transporter transmembrane domain-containing protein [Oceanococcus sp.]
MIAVPMLIPLIAALLIGLSGRWPNLREALSVVAGIATGVSVWLLHLSGGGQFLLTDFGGGMSLYWASEPLGLLFALVAGCLWPVTAVYAAGYLRGAKEKNQTRFFIFMAISIAAAQCIALAGNLFTLFVGYEIMTLATWPLVSHKGNADAQAGGRTYLAYLLPSSVALLLPAILIVQISTGTSVFTDGGVLESAGFGPMALGLLYALFVFGIGKAALMPMHGWLPAAMVAPTPVSALLHAVAVVKAGVFCVLKVTLYIFGLDTLSASGASEPIVWVAAFSMIAASLVALHADNLKRRLAYSTVSQLAYVTLAAALASAAAAYAGSLQILMHAFGKITLFFCAGAIYVAHKKTLVSQLDGLGRQMPLTFIAFTLGALSIIGLPPLGGSWTKWWLMIGALDAQHAWLLGVMALSTLLNIAYLLPIPARAFLAGDTRWQWAEAPLACLLPLCFTALVSLWLFFQIPMANSLMQMTGAQP